MSAIETKHVVESFDNITCPGCGKLAAISTRMGNPIACPCGVSNTAIGVVVVSSGDCAAPDWQDRQAAAGRAGRAKELALGMSVKGGATVSVG